MTRILTRGVVASIASISAPSRTLERHESYACACDDDAAAGRASPATGVALRQRDGLRAGRGRVDVDERVGSDVDDGARCRARRARRTRGSGAPMNTVSRADAEEPLASGDPDGSASAAARTGARSMRPVTAAGAVARRVDDGERRAREGCAT